MSTNEIAGWVVACFAVLGVGSLAYWGACRAFRQACVGLTPGQVESLQLHEVMSKTPLRKQVTIWRWTPRCPMGVWLLLWPAFVIVVVGSVSVSAQFATVVWDSIAAVLPHFFSEVVTVEPLAQPPARAGLMGLALYLLIRLPSTMAGLGEGEALPQRSSRLAGVVAFYKHVRSLFISELTFGGQREQVVTDLAEDICDHWFPLQPRYEEERARAFQWLAKNIRLEDSPNPHRTVFGAMEVKGLPYVVSELRSQMPSARKEIRRRIGPQLILTEDGQDSIEHKVRAEEVGCSGWNEVSSFRLCPASERLQEGQVYVVRRIDGHTLRKAQPAEAHVIAGRTVLRLLDPSHDAAMALRAVLN